ncbi:MAG: uL15m family ribosomal protein [Candidatus Liptonbacteria bacterium]|nr:uL15m family ribosomal protein [Candidatus Liptonbacteria bacterium]
MQLHSIHKSTHDKRAKRIGRSGKRGSYSGRGVKGQKSRSGRRLRPAERDLILRLPKRRGFANKIKSENAAIFNLKNLSLAIKSHKEKGALMLDIDFLKQNGMLPMRFSGKVKLLGDGEVDVPIELKGIKVSESAKKKIEKAGGNVARPNINRMKSN